MLNKKKHFNSACKFSSLWKKLLGALEILLMRSHTLNMLLCFENWGKNWDLSCLNILYTISQQSVFIPYRQTSLRMFCYIMYANIRHILHLFSVSFTVFILQDVWFGAKPLKMSVTTEEVNSCDQLLVPGKLSWSKPTSFSLTKLT